jgi:hypothetical protein
MGRGDIAIFGQQAGGDLHFAGGRVEAGLTILTQQSFLEVVGGIHKDRLSSSPVLYSISPNLTTTKPQGNPPGAFAVVELQLTVGREKSRPGIRKSPLVICPAQGHSP